MRTANALEPAATANRLEREPSLPQGSDERFRGYEVMGVLFESGHLLALRRFPASSIGRGCTSVWHRGPGGDWTFYSDGAPACSCARYFGSALIDAVSDDVDVRWIGPRELVVSAREARLTWSIRLTDTPATRIVNRVLRSLPAAAWRRERLVRLLGRVGGRLLGAGPIRLAGRTPNGQRFLAMPREMWAIRESRATLEGADLGAPRILRRRIRLGDFVIPARPLFALGDARMEAFDDAVHVALVSRTERFAAGALARDQRRSPIPCP